MAKFTDYTEKVTPDDVDIFLLQDSSATKKVSFLNIFNKIKTKLGLGTLATKNTISQADLEAALLNIINGKLGSSDIINNLTSTDATKVLSAAQGKTLKDGVDTLNSKLDLITNTATKSENISGNPIVKQFGSVKMLKINTTTTLNMAVGTEYILCTLLTNQRPDSDVIKYLHQGKITISASGGVTLNPTANLSNGQYLHITETFI